MILFFSTFDTKHQEYLYMYSRKIRILQYPPKIRILQYMYLITKPTHQLGSEGLSDDREQLVIILMVALASNMENLYIRVVL